MPSSPPADQTFLERLRLNIAWRTAVIVVVALGVVGVLAHHDLVGGAVPTGVLLGMIVGAWLLVSVADALVGAEDSMRSVWLMTVPMTLTIGAIVYATGWGPALAIAFGAVAAERLAMHGSRATIPVMISASVAMTAGQILIALGIAPSYIPSPQVQGVGAISLAGLLIVVFMMGNQAQRREAADAHARDSAEWFRALVQHASDAIVVFDRDQAHVQYVSPAFERLLGRSGAEVTEDILHPDDLAAFHRTLDGLDADGQGWVECRARHADGTYHTLEVGLSDLRANAAIGGYVANLRDVTERRLFEEQLSYQAYHDPLTHLPNRRQYLERLEAALERTRAVESTLAVIFLDVDQFKIVNDSLGHEVGDRLLVEIATRLRSCLRPGDVVARFGGDEFTVLLEDVAGSADAIVVAERILESLREPIAVGGRELHAGASIGIAISGVATDDLDAGELLREADLAMYVAKERGRGRWELFDAHSAPEVVERLEIEGGLRRGIEAGQLVVFFQPEVTLDRGEVVGLEALVRWQHPTRGLLYPGAFVPFAEESSLILEIDRFVLRESMRYAARWNRGRDVRQPVRVSVNLSARFLHQAEAVDEITTLLDDSDCEPGWLQVEITERVTIDGDARAIQRLHELQAAGISIAIDDFGTGYSSLAYLRDLPVDVLKLDQSFIASLDAAAQSAIVAAVITMGHALGVWVTAEGVEHDAQVTELRSLGCDSVQGFRFSAAVPADEVPALIERLTSGAVEPRLTSVPSEAAS